MVRLPPGRWCEVFRVGGVKPSGGGNGKRCGTQGVNQRDEGARTRGVGGSARGRSGCWLGHYRLPKPRNRNPFPSLLSHSFTHPHPPTHTLIRSSSANSSSFFACCRACSTTSALRSTSLASRVRTSSTDLRLARTRLASFSWRNLSNLPTWRWKPGGGRERWVAMWVVGGCEGGWREGVRWGGERQE
eukprot:scaffold20083_cov101-Isochrysis_galbana.AAC.2